MSGLGVGELDQIRLLEEDSTEAVAHALGFQVVVAEEPVQPDAGFHLELLSSVACLSVGRERAICLV